MLGNNQIWLVNCLLFLCKLPVNHNQSQFKGTLKAAWAKGNQPFIISPLILQVLLEKPLNTNLQIMSVNASPSLFFLSILLVPVNIKTCCARCKTDKSLKKRCKGRSLFVNKSYNYDTTIPFSYRTWRGITLILGSQKFQTSVTLPRKEFRTCERFQLGNTSLLITRVKAVLRKQSKWMGVKLNNKR